MELKVWCDGIPRVVCGASATTTCQDVVFALAHATGQVGRFILIEKWRHCERVLAPGDRPLASLSKFGEYASDCQFVMKKSGEVSQNNINKAPRGTLMLNKKSDTELVQTRKVLVNSQLADQNIPPMMTTKSAATLNSSTLPHRSHHKTEPFVRSISFHKPTELSESSHFSTGAPKGGNHVPSSETKASNSASNIFSASYHSASLHDKSNNESSAKHEPVYSTSSKNRPPQPPPYKEAIAKSSLFNANSSNGIYGYVGGNSANHKGTITSSQFGQNGSQPKPSPLLDHQMNNNSNNNSRKHLSQVNYALEDFNKTKTKNISELHQETRNIIDLQQQAMKKQEKDIVSIDKELSLVQRKLTQNEHIVQQYKEEMEFLKQIWLDQETIIEKLEEEHLEEELEQLIAEAKGYEEEMRDVKQKLADCESEIAKSREHICILLNNIEDAVAAKSQAKEDDDSLYQNLQKTILEKTKEIESQKCDLNVISASIEHLDKSIQEKNDIIDKLVIEIKDANVEGLSLQNLQDQTRKISVLPHELGNTVPTKKNPDGIWV